MSDPHAVRTVPAPTGHATAAGHGVSRRAPFDLVVHALILGLGLLQFFLYLRADDFVTEATYYELAQSLLGKGWYGYNSRFETMLPPGCAAMIAVVCVCFGSSFATIIRSMAVSATLFLTASYELLRRQVGRGPAAAICLLIGSSPTLFRFSTRILLSDLPYAFTSTLALLVVMRLDAATNRLSRVLLGLTLALMLACSEMLRSAAVTLLAGLGAWLLVSILTGRENSRARLKTFAPLIALGIAIQVLWMGWAKKNENLQWSLPGYPGSYVSQLKLKRGCYPELGNATAVDVVRRIHDNLDARSAELVRILTRLRPTVIEGAWHSPVVLGTILLILLGLRHSCWTDESGPLHWYFAGHEAMYLLWPWDLEIRFILPVVPLACVYLWRGGAAASALVGREPRKYAGLMLVLATVMTGYTTLPVIRYHQAGFSAVCWLLLALASAGVLWIRGAGGRATPGLFRAGALRAVAVSAVAALVVAGLVLQVRMGVENLDFEPTEGPHYPCIEAAQWVRSHAGPDDVVMARKEDLVYHYCGHRVLWFPPCSDPRILMDGIVKHEVRWIIVVDRDSSYFLPPDSECFAALARAYPSAFRLAHRGPGNQVFRLEPLRSARGRSEVPRRESL